MAKNRPDNNSMRSRACITHAGFGLLFLLLALQAGATPALAADERDDDSPPVVESLMRRATAFEGDGDETQPNAVQLYCVAARLGDSEAQYRLGLMLLEGRGSRRNVESAATLFSLAAGTGHEDATTMLSIIGIKRETWPECFANVFPAIVDCQ